jgi:hypothetical protein
MIATQSNPVESNDTIKCLHAQQKVCTRIVRQSEALGGNWKTEPGSRKGDLGAVRRGARERLGPSLP